MEKDLEARTKRFAPSVIRFFFFLAPNSGGGCLGASTSSFCNVDRCELSGGKSWSLAGGFC